MADIAFAHHPVGGSPPVRGRWRRIVTPIPVPESIPILETLEACEARSMQGQLPVVWDRAEDFQVFDRWGNCWIDFTSTIFVANAGHANPRVKAALRECLDRNLMHSYTFATELRARYLRKLTSTTGFEKAFLLSSGTEATECAIKLMRLFGRAEGKRRNGIISFEGSMHGRTMGAQFVGGTPELRAWIGHEDPDVFRLPFPYPWRSADAREDLAHLGVDLRHDVCGILVESYQGWGAAFLPEEYVRTLARIARENDILLAFDEIQAGFGRTGKFFAFEHYGVMPDLVCCGKGMGSGYPLAGVLGRASVLDLPGVGSMSSTHSANPLACAAGLATLEEFESCGLVAESARKGEILHAELRNLRAEFPEQIRYVFGRGLVAAVVTENAELATRVCESAMRKGLLLVHTGRESVKIGPPLTIPDDAMREGLEVLHEAMREESFEPVAAP